jgi:hypothetical protein
MAKRSGVALALPALVLAAFIGRCGAGTQSTPQSAVDSSPSASRSALAKTAPISPEIPTPARHEDLRPPESAPRPQAKGPTPKDVARLKRQLIQESIEQYSGSCPCPYNSASNGSSCGRRSAYSRPGGASPLCYPSDVTESMVAAAWLAEAGR